MGNSLSANVQRAKRLLQAGVVGGHAVGLLCVAIFWLAFGRNAGVTALLGAALVILFSTIGQAVIMVVADADPKVVLLTSLASYLGRVTLLGLLLLVALNNTQYLAFIYPAALLLSVVLTVFGWLFAEFWMFRNLRIPAFDPPALDVTTFDPLTSDVSDFDASISDASISDAPIFDPPILDASASDVSASDVRTLDI